MGYVFTPEEFDARRIPSIGGYETAKKRVEGALRDLHAGGFVEGAVINGSAREPRVEIGSDLDVVVITKNNVPRAEEELGSVSSRIAEEFFVPVEFVPVSLDLARTGNHGISYLYFVYLRDWTGEPIGRHPADFLAPAESWKNPRAEVMESTASKLRKLSKSRASGTPQYGREHCSYLEKVLRQPLWNAIDMLRLTTNGQMPVDSDGKLLPKDACIALYEKTFKPAVRGLRHIAELRAAYREFLRASVAGESTHDGCSPGAAYRQLLDRIDGAYPMARHFMEQNLRVLRAI